MDVGAWLRGLGLGQYEAAFVANGVDAEVLPHLTAEDLREIGVDAVGHRRKLLRAVALLGAGASATAPARPDSAAERRQLTVMFVDLVGSTALSHRLDPEEMGGVLRAFQDAVAGGIARFEGHVAKFLGDGVLAYFGWPKAQEDAAERAVRAGLGIVATVARLEAPGGEPLTCRVGIATGLVVVGELIGEGTAREEAVVGETPNLAARLQGLAEPGAVVVAGSTCRLLGGLFVYRDLGVVTLKGFAETVAAYQVLGEGGAEGRFEALRAAGLTPLVGREHELALLLDRWQQAKDGEGQVVLLSGEAGIGKSRLVRALRERLGGEPHTPLTHFCSPYHTNTALHPVVGLLERGAGLCREDPPRVQLDRLEAMLAHATEDVREAAPLLAELLAIPVPPGRYPPLELSPRQRKERTFEALLDQLAGLAARRPVLALYEDVHWADPTTLELLDRTVERARRVPALVVVTFRPGFVPPWTGHGHVTALSLGRLGRRQGGAMVERVAGGKALPAEVLEQILAKTDGVPLFVEELTKTVLETGLLVDAGDHYELAGPLPPLAIPSTLQDSLMARLDRLAPVKEVAQVAAVIGREFSHDLLAAVVSRDGDELRDALDQLIGAGLVFRRREAGEAGYAFKHALVRDAAFQSLLRSRRRELHARIAVALEERFPAVAGSAPELLARHYAGAGLAERAARRWHEAAEVAIARSANLEAAAHCDEAVAQLRTLPPSAERARAELEVQLAKGVAVRAGKGYAALECEQVFARACELCEELGDRVRLVHAARGWWSFYCVAGRWRDAARVADRIATTARGLQDRVALSVGWYVEGMTKLYRGQPAEAVSMLREALRHYDEADRDAYIRLSGHDMGTSIAGHLSLAEWLAGLPEQAARTSGEGLEVARRVAHPLSLALALALGAMLRVLARDWEAAEALAAELREAAIRYGIAGYVAFAEMLAGVAVAARGDAIRGAALVRGGTAGLRRTGWQWHVPLLLVELAVALRACGDADAAIETAGEALRMARATGELAWEAEALRAAGEVKLATGTADAVEVEADLRAAIDVAERQGAKAFQLRAATSLARLWAGQGKRRRGRDLLAPIYGRFTEGFGTSDLREARELLDELR